MVGFPNPIILTSNHYILKNSFIFSIILSTVIIAGCHTGTSGNQQQDSATTASANRDTAAVSATPKDSFDITSVPISDKVLDSFPFVKIPPGMKYQNSPVQKKYDMIFFPLNGVMTPLYGSVFKSYIVSANDDNGWSLPLFQQYYADSIKAAGGVQVFNAKVAQTELDRVKEKATYWGEEGSIDYWNDPVEVYVIHRATGGNIFIQFSGNSASGAIQVLQVKTAAEAMQP